MIPDSVFELLSLVEQKAPGAVLADSLPTGLRGDILAIAIGEGLLSRSQHPVLRKVSTNGWPAGSTYFAEHLFLTDAGRTDLARRRMTPKPEPVSEPNGVPAEYREGGRIDGEPLTPSYLIGHEEWGLTFRNRKRFTDLYDKKRLTSRVPIGNTYAYLYTELSTIQREDSLEAK